ncbi:MAG: 16S rRNA (cytosine(1402)-N(4))-methyltransferase RsmH [Pseudohongiellaceae bacterium]
MVQSSAHESVLLEESVCGLDVQTNGVYVDATFGRGGHSAEILKRLGNQGRLLVFDRDLDAIAVASKLSAEDPRVVVVHAPFSELGKTVNEMGLTGQVDGVLFDLGVSSPQLDNPERGFSFMRSGPLDMRMDTTRGTSASQWINAASEKEIADVIYQFGEERHSRRMARRVVEERQESPIEDTGRLAEIIKQANPAWEKDKHPATRAFQGIRIFINEEFAELESGISQAVNLIKVGGRLVIISFHSLEDRIVKKFISLQAKGDKYPRDLPIMNSQLSPVLKSIGKAQKASHAELAKNPRSRSAVLRVAEKISDSKLV